MDNNDITDKDIEDIEIDWLQAELPLMYEGKTVEYQSINEIIEKLIAHRQNSQWVSVETFQQEANEMWCWIKYKGRVVHAYHDHNEIFRFHIHSSNCYMTECISAVMPLPTPPTNERDT